METTSNPNQCKTTGCRQQVTTDDRRCQRHADQLAAMPLVRMAETPASPEWTIPAPVQS